MEPEDFAVVDLSAIPADDWPAYFFDRPVPPLVWGGSSDPELWPEIEIQDGERALDALTQLLLDFARIGQIYSLEQINQGVWAMWGCEYELHRLFWDEALPWPARERGIRAMLAPFRDFVAGHPVETMENCFYMWWDLIAPSPPSMSSDDVARTKQIYLETLQAILALDDGRCQQAALHGLGHLGHPDRPTIVQAFMDERPELSLHPEGRRWLEACRDGNVM